MNASQPRQRAKGGKCQNSGSYAVSSKPVENAGFTWERVAACQSVSGTQYTLHEECPEREYFTPLLKKAVTLASNLDGAPRSDLLDAVVVALNRSQDYEDEFEAFNIKSIEFGQLEYVQHPIVSHREPPKDDPAYVPAEFFETYAVNQATGSSTKAKEVLYVQAPVCEVRTSLPNARHGGSGFAFSHSAQKPSQPVHPSQTPHASYSAAHVASTTHPIPASRAASPLISAQSIHASHSEQRPRDLESFARSA
jgi:hypothetical protein